MSKEVIRKSRRAARRRYSDELKSEAVQMLLDGHSAASVASNLGLSSVTLLYRWKAQWLERSGPAAASLEERVRQLEEELHRVERERDILPLDRSTSRVHVSQHLSRFLDLTVRGVRRSWWIC